MKTRSAQHVLCKDPLVKVVLTVLALLGAVVSDAQDSIAISYSQEPDTLVKQRFIDRYENVFMTKVPTRQMFKIGYSGYTGAGFRLGYEFKILPHLSIEATIYSKLNQYDFNTVAFGSGRRFWASAKSRWYYDMGKRVDQALSANNFSGSYFGISYEQSIQEYGGLGLNAKNTGRFGLSYGFQSRFFNRGYVDLSVGLFNKSDWKNKFLFEQDNSGFFSPKDFVLTTQSAFGIAMGDWKKSKRAPACEVLLCDEQISDQWKVQLPDITVGLRLQTGNTSIAYERRIGGSPFSVEASVSAWLTRRTTSDVVHATYYFTGGVHLRYYYLQKMQLRRGSGGGNFSGPYAGIGASSLLSGFHVKDVQARYKDHAWYETATFSMGYQQRLFKSLYIDGSVYYSDQFGDYRGGYNVPSNKIYSKVSFGFTF
jgi:hypothetical protein